MYDMVNKAIQYLHFQWNEIYRLSTVNTEHASFVLEGHLFQR